MLSDANSGTCPLPVTIVSGLPRSGTSMMMAMLEAGGIVPLIDEHRPPDESNRNGYFEFRPVLSSRESVAWLPQATGKAVKVIYALLDSLPPEYEYRVIFMMRDVREVVESQQRMLDRLGRPGALQDSRNLAGVFERERDRILRWLEDRKNFRVLKIDYREMLANPEEGCLKLRQILDSSLDFDSMARVVSPALRTVSLD